MPEKEIKERTVLGRRRQVDGDTAEVTLSKRSFETVGPATGKARPPKSDMAAPTHNSLFVIHQ